MSQMQQSLVVSAVLSTVFSCGLGLGYIVNYTENYVVNGHNKRSDATLQYLRWIEIAGESAFLPSIVIIPGVMQRKGRRPAMLLTIIPLLLSWIFTLNANFTSLFIINISHTVSIAGVVAIGSIIISEFCGPKHRAMFLMLETTVISLGVLLSHIGAMFSCWKSISIVGSLSAFYSLVAIYFSLESPYWLISQGYIDKCTENFYLLRGRNDEAKNELELLIGTYEIKFQTEALKPVRKTTRREKLLDYLKSLFKTDFLKPLSIMILLFSFVGFGGENIVTNYSVKNFLQLTNRKYIGAIVLDVLSITCSLVACVLIQIVQRKQLFVFTGAICILFIVLASLFLFVQSSVLLLQDFTWLFLSFVTGFVMFMSLGTAAMPLSLLGEIFPMSYKGVGSSLTCAYIWAFGNSVLKYLPISTDSFGTHSTLFIAACFMTSILVILSKMLPEVSLKSLIEIENLYQYKSNEYETVSLTDRNDGNFNNLQLLIEV